MRYWRSRPRFGGSAAQTMDRSICGPPRWCWPSNGSRKWRSNAGSGRDSLFLHRLFQHVFGDVDRHFRGNGQGDGVAGPAIHLDQLAVLANAQLGKIGVLAQFTDIDVLKIAAELFDGAGDQVVRQRPRRLLAAHAAIDAGRLEDADDDRKAAVAVHLAEHDDLLVVDFI